jgi:hypothetical protein
MNDKINDVGIENRKEGNWKMCAFPLLFISVVIFLLKIIHFVSAFNNCLQYPTLRNTALEDSASSVTDHT